MAGHLRSRFCILEHFLQTASQMCNAEANIQLLSVLHIIFSWFWPTLDYLCDLEGNRRNKRDNLFEVGSAHIKFPSLKWSDTNISPTGLLWNLDHNKEGIKLRTT